MQNVLIAEDEPAISETLSFLLGRAGWRCETVADGEAVLPTLRRRRAGLVILDIMLPGRSGLDVLRALRGDSDYAGLPVLILTARGQKADRQLALDLGADGFISKPFANDELIREVQRLLGLPAETGGR